MMTTTLFNHPDAIMDEKPLDETYRLHPLDAGKINREDKPSFAEDRRLTMGREHYRFPLTVSRGRQTAKKLVGFVLLADKVHGRPCRGKGSTEGRDEIFGILAQLQETLRMTRSRARSARIGPHAQVQKYLPRHSWPHRSTIAGAGTAYANGATTAQAVSPAGVVLQYSDYYHYYSYYFYYHLYYLYYYYL